MVLLQSNPNYDHLLKAHELIAGPRLARVSRYKCKAGEAINNVLYILTPTPAVTPKSESPNPLHP